MAFLHIKFDKFGNQKIQQEDQDINKNNQKLMGVIKKMHSVVENEDLDRQRHAQDNFGTLFGTHPFIEFRQQKMGMIDAE